MKHTNINFNKKILYYFIYFVLCIKFLYILFFLFDKYLNISNKIKNRKGSQNETPTTHDNSEKLEKKIFYYKTLSENIFIVSISILVIYLFYPYHRNDLLTEFLNNKYGKFLIFIYGIFVLISFNWQSFRPEFI